MVYGPRFSVILTLVLVVGILAGCQPVARGAGNKGDLETMMSVFADDFVRDDGVDKEDLHAMFDEGIASGIEFGTSNLKIKVADDGKSAEAEGVEIDYIPYYATLEKRSGAWVIVGGGESY
jgi:(p)ppGpp synthase/HD superfamily hydrolase